MRTPSLAIVVTIASLFSCLAAGCSGGGSLTPSAPSSIESTTRSVESGTVAATATASPTPLPAFGVSDFGGLKGATYTAHTSGSAYDYAETVTIDFTQPVNMPSFNAHVAITPATAWSSYVINYGKRVELTIRKTPGTRYTITMGAGLAASGGATLTAPVTFAFTTSANVTVPAPLRAVTGEPYRYGFLAHPDGDTLGGPNAPEIAGILGNLGTGFVRIDYAAAQIMPTATTTNFAPSDAIVALLASHGMTVLPILEQYSTAAWQSEGQPYPAIFSTPQLYAQYVSTVVAHLRATAPQITRIELFNEPNLQGWWTNPNPAYAATNGSATAAYMLAGYAAAKAANPAITVVGPALSDGGNAVDPRTFLTTMYGAGCRTGRCWDVLSVHPYAWVDPTYTMTPSAANRWQIYQDLQAIAVAHGDAKPHVMLTEWAFSTVDQPDGFDPQVQARYLALGFNLMLADPTIDGIVWTSVYATGTDFWSRVAVTTASYTLLPAASAFRSFTTP
jgi:hypothetical protein